MRKALLVLLLAFSAFAANSRPKVRAVTAFVDIDAKNYASQFDNTMRFLNGAREAYRRAGFEVETVRIVTQPFPKYAAGMKREEAVAFFHKLNDLAATSGFSLNIGASMLNDNDDAAPNALLAEVLSTGKINASLVIAGDDGIHWRALLSDVASLAYKWKKPLAARLLPVLSGAANPGCSRLSGGSLTAPSDT